MKKNKKTTIKLFISTIIIISGVLLFNKYIGAKGDFTFSVLSIQNQTIENAYCQSDNESGFILSVVNTFSKPITGAEYTIEKIGGDTIGITKLKRSTLDETIECFPTGQYKISIGTKNTVVSLQTQNVNKITATTNSNKINLYSTYNDRLCTDPINRGGQNPRFALVNAITGTCAPKDYSIYFNYNSSVGDNHTDIVDRTDQNGIFFSEDSLNWRNVIGFGAQTSVENNYYKLLSNPVNPPFVRYHFLQSPYPAQYSQNKLTIKYVRPTSQSNINELTLSLQNSEGNRIKNINGRDEENIIAGQNTVTYTGLFPGVYSIIVTGLTDDSFLPKVIRLKGAIDSGIIVTPKSETTLYAIPVEN